MATPKDSARFKAQKSRLLAHLHNSFGHFGLSFKACEYGDEKGCHIEIRVNKARFISPRDDFFDGLEIIWYCSQRLFEVVETMAGPKENELWVYLETKCATVAIGEYMKGNKRKSSAIKIWT